MYGLGMGVKEHEGGGQGRQNKLAWHGVKYKQGKTGIALPF